MRPTDCPLPIFAACPTPISLASWPQKSGENCLHIRAFTFQGFPV